MARFRGLRRTVARAAICGSSVGDERPAESRSSGAPQAGVTPDEAIGQLLSDGRKVLELLFTQHEWTHRRVETISLEAHGETRQRVSWDFTLDPDLAINAGPGRVAIPLATLRKAPLKRLDLTDATGGALAMWGTRENGNLGTEALISGLEGTLRRSLHAEECDLLRGIVFASGLADAEPSLLQLEGLLLAEGGGENAEVLMALARDLAENFLLVAELPQDVAGVRSLVKLKYDGDIGEAEDYSPLSTAHQTRLDGAAWSSAGSWHLELHAPPGLAVRKLVRMTENGSGPAREAASAAGQTAHLSGSTTGIGTSSWAEVELRPARAGLVNQTLGASIVGVALSSLAVIATRQLELVVADPNRGSALAGVALAVPAFVIALLARGPEHPLVSRLLLAPRLINLAVAAVLLATAAVLVLDLSSNAFWWSLRVLWVVQVVLVMSASAIRKRAVGAEP